MKIYTYIYNMELFRIKQISKDKFIPQKCDGIPSWVFGQWEGLEFKEGEKEDELLIWYTDELQEQYCTTDSLERAKNVITQYKKTLKEDKQYPKYHKAS